MGKCDFTVNYNSVNSLLSSARLVYEKPGILVIMTYPFIFSHSDSIKKNFFRSNFLTKSVRNDDDQSMV